jgi:hypothetical protein
MGCRWRDDGGAHGEVEALKRGADSNRGHVPALFQREKTVQAASFVLKQNGGSMDKYIFIQMLYLSDREGYKKWSQPITGDEAVSMEFGPVLSAVYDLTRQR